MRIICFVLVSVFSIKESSGGAFSFPNPLDIAKNVASKVDQGAVAFASGAKNVATKFDEGVVAAATSVGTGSKNGVIAFATGAKAVATKVDEGVVAAATGVGTGAKAVASAAVVADAKIYNGTKSVVQKVQTGVFFVGKGFVNGVEEVVGTPVNLNELSFYLVTAETVENPTKIDFYKPDDVANTKGKIYFIIHGWQSSRNASWFHDLSKILTTTQPDAHVIQVDWSGPAGDNYAFSAFDTESVGSYVGLLINRLVTEYKVPVENIVLIGHSLGGQVAGWAGKKFRFITGKTLPRIIALDPAGPLFLLRPDARRLNRKDALVVMVVHSDGGKLGYLSAVGTIDFFPNGGSHQPGCWSIDLEHISSYLEPVTCDHSRAWDFFVEAVNNTGSFLAKKCDSYRSFGKNLCDAIEVAMGDLLTKEEGTFYLETHPERPYSKFMQRVVDDIKGGIQHIKDDVAKMRSRFSTGDTNNETTPADARSSTDGDADKSQELSNKSKSSSDVPGGEAGQQAPVS